MIKGVNLIADIDSFCAARDRFAFWWLGQHSFIVKFREAVVYIDPYLSDDPDRQVKSLLQAEDIVNADLVLGTHDHDDHIDRPVWPKIAKMSSGVRFVVPELLREGLARELKIPSRPFVGLSDEQSVEINGLKITAVAAAHEFLDRDAESGLYPYLGYVIETDGFTVYHAGDTCKYEGLETKLKKWNFDLALLPINGRDAERLSSGCIGNMTYQEAADLAGAIRPGLTVPAHYDMFAENSEDPKVFVDYMNVKYPGLEVCVCDYGKRIIVNCK